MMIIDYADYIDLHKATLKIISSLTTLTALIIKITWRIVFYHDYADYADALTTLTKLTTLIFNSTWKIISSLTTLTTLLWKATIDNTFITDYVDIQKWKIVMTDYVDNPVLHITVTYTGIFSRNFSVVLHVSLAGMYVYFG